MQSMQRPPGGRPRSLGETVYARLRAAIWAGEYEPGMPLSEGSVSAALGTGRTPVREALLLLAHDGLIKVIPNKGGVVATPSLGEALNALHLRCLIEPEIARLVAATATDPLVAALNVRMEALARATEAADVRGWMEIDFALHQTIVDACPNCLLRDLSLQSRHRTKVGVLEAMPNPASLRARLDGYRALVAAIRDRDAAGAHSAMAEQIETLRAGLSTRFV